MKIGLTQLILGGAGAQETLDFSVEAGFNIVELVFGDDRDPSMDMTDKELKALSSRFSDAGVKITSILGRPAGNPATISPDKDVRKKAIEGLKRTIEIADIVGAGALLLHPGQNSADITYDDAWNFLSECLHEAAPVAEAHKVHICIENVWNRFLLSPREMRQFIDEMQSDWIGCYLDVANMMLYGYAEQWISELGSRIKRVHFKDFDRKERKFVPLTEGETDWPRVLSMLDEIGYDDGFIHEVGGPREVQLETANRMREICRK